MIKHDIIVIGASAGGIQALIEIVKGLPEDFQASIFIVQHIPAHSPSKLPEILSRSGHLKAINPSDGEKIESGKIYIAPPDHHLLIEKNHIIIKKGPKENRFRPSVDALFRSAAYVYGSRVIGVVLSGYLDDGTSGLWSVKRRGGISIVQNPEDAEYPYMPLSVLEYVEVDHIVPVSKIADLLIKLTKQEAPSVPKISESEMKRLELEVIISSKGDAFELGILNMGELTSLTCPECHGALISLKEGKLVRFRCHTGHAFTSSTLLAGITKSVEEKLWEGMRGMEEATILLEKMAAHFNDSGKKESAKLFSQKAKETKKRAKVIHDLTFSQEVMSSDNINNKK